MIIEDFYLHLIQIRLKKNNLIFTKNINLINDFGLLKVQYNYEQYYNNKRNRFLREEYFYQTNF